MARTQYNQPTLSITDQLNLLSDRGLTLPDQAEARHLLENISMFRLKGYLYPFEQNHLTHQFKPGASLAQALMLHHFDVALRSFVLSMIARVEVSVRTQISQTVSERTDQFWYIDSSNFSNVPAHSDLLLRLRNEIARSDDDQIVSFRNQYINPWPPCWMAVELSSMGNLSKMYKLLGSPNDRRTIAGYYDLADPVMESWLHSLTYVRNICAHHGRLWNRTLRISPSVPRRPRHPFMTRLAANNRIYFVLCIIKYMLDVIEPNNDMHTRLRWLFVDYPQIDPRAMGFPDNWELEPLWR